MIVKRRGFVIDTRPDPVPLVRSRAACLSGTAAKKKKRKMALVLTTVLIVYSSEYFAAGGVRAERLGPRFYDRPCEELAKSLLGKVLVRRVPPGRGDDDDHHTVVRGRIVETECYAGATDAASHSYGGRRTARNEPMYMRPGTVYVYMTYGMYYCVNISSAGGFRLRLVYLTRVV